MKEQIGGYDWSKHDAPIQPIGTRKGKVDIDDETLRDGLQGAQLETHPTLAEKKVYLRSASQFVEHFDIGFPGSESNHQDDIRELINYKLSRGLDISLSCAARGPVKVDILPIIHLRHQTGYPLEADIFHDASQQRAIVEKWDRDEKIAQLVENVRLLKKNGVPVMMVLERSTSTYPQEFFEICKISADLGVDRLCIADTQGRANPRAITNILRAAKAEVGQRYPDIKWDLHSHNDRGLGVVNCLIASEEGVDRVHATNFCIGERSGNVDLATLLVNLNIEGHRHDDLRGLKQFCEMTSELFHFPIPANAPVIGKSAFSTGSGVHAAAHYKEQETAIEGFVGIYFAYNPADVGAQPEVRVGSFSGEANVRVALSNLGIEAEDEVIRAILAEAKSGRGLLSDATIRGIAKQFKNNHQEQTP